MRWKKKLMCSFVQNLFFFFCLFVFFACNNCSWLYHTSFCLKLYHNSPNTEYLRHHSVTRKFLNPIKQYRHHDVTLKHFTFSFAI